MLAECTSDHDCPYHKSCINERCLDPCTHGSVSCGRDAECKVQFHRASCECPQGTQGDPRISCISGHCQYDSDCADHEACDRLNRVCSPVCSDRLDTCGVNAYCTGVNHGEIQKLFISKISNLC